MRPGISAFLISLLLAFLPTHAQELSSDSERFSLHGKVVNPSSGEPVSGALLLIDGQQAQFTGADGTFTFTNLNRGQHDLTPPRKPGFFDPFQLSQVRVFPTRELQVPLSGDLALPLIPEAIIYGEVKNELGEPAQGVTVRARRWQTENGRRSLDANGSDA